MSGLPRIVQNCHSTRHKYQILHITTTAVHLSYRLLYFKPPNVAGKLISEAPYFRRFFLSIAEKRFLTSSPVRRFFFYSPNVAEKVFLHKTSSDQFAFFCESPKSLEISRLRRQSLHASHSHRAYCGRSLFFRSQAALKMSCRQRRLVAI